MRLFSSLGPHHPAPAAPVPEPPPPPPPPTARNALGVLPCTSRGCVQETGIACAYVDRRERRCPTAWCPGHRAVRDGAVYCPLHARTLGDTDDHFSEHHRPDLDNPVPLLVSWVARELEKDINTLMARVCREHREVLVADPVRFVLVGVDRVRTWERAWKMCSHTGVSLRVHVAVEEAAPDTVLVKVGSRVVGAAPPPSPEVRALAEDPAVPRLSQVETFRAALVGAAAEVVDRWREAHPAGSPQPWSAPPAPRHVDLTGRRDD